MATTAKQIAQGWRNVQHPPCKKQMGNHTPQQLQSLNFKGNISRSKLQSSPLQRAWLFVGFVCMFILNYPTMEHLHSKLLKSLQALLSLPSSTNIRRHGISALDAQTAAWEMNQSSSHASEYQCLHLAFVWTQRREAVIQPLQTALKRPGFQPAVIYRTAHLGWGKKAAYVC